MLPHRTLPGLLPRRLFALSSRMASTSTSSTPVEDLIRDKITSAFTPSTLIIRNDSHLHAHHAPMQGSTSRETHFHVTVTSPSFQSKPQPARHRMVYALLKEEMSREGGIHALQLRTKTPEEEEREAQRKAQGQA
ncbi:bola-like protein [Aspergillus ellipticus CBS 707.79]|uniref:Bola-like protein n=1 Tax=Aspergillus ellipticus CBS 707.79 TaxID=1448320 RepID=A0A319ET02_9EURO|nr:bola-like protein [Aspergillus ellipticus CBS 707.79]